ncbi:MAG: hypothetical protein ACRC80_38800 [Waterburya sp.]
MSTNKYIDDKSSLSGQKLSVVNQNTNEIGKANIGLLHKMNEVAAITDDALVPTQFELSLIPITANSTTDPVIVTVPLASSQLFPITFYRDDYNPAFLAGIKTTGADKIFNMPSTAILAIDTNTNISEVIQFIPVTGGYIVTISRIN